MQISGGIVTGVVVAVAFLLTGKDNASYGVIVGVLATLVALVKSPDAGWPWIISAGLSCVTLSAVVALL